MLVFVNLTEAHDRTRDECDALAEKVTRLQQALDSLIRTFTNVMLANRDDLLNDYLPP